MNLFPTGFVLDPGKRNNLKSKYATIDQKVDKTSKSHTYITSSILIVN